MFWCNYGRLWFTECKIAWWYQHHGQLMQVAEVCVWAWCQHQLAHQHFGFHWLEALLVFSHLPVHFRTFRRRRLHGSAVSSVKYLVVGGVGFPLLLSSCRRPFPLFTLHSSLDKLNIYTACLLTPRVHSGRRVANPHVASVNVTTSPTACKLTAVSTWLFIWAKVLAHQMFLPVWHPNPWCSVINRQACESDGSCSVCLNPTLRFGQGYYIVFRLDSF